MKKLFAVLIVAACISCAGLGSMTYIVSTPTGTYFITKSKPNFSYVFIDTSQWAAGDYFQFPEIKDAVLSRKILSYNNIRLKILAMENAKNASETVLNSSRQISGKIKNIFH